MITLLNMAAILLSIILAGIVAWYARGLRAYLDERRERAEAVNSCVDKFDKEIAAVSDMAAALQSELHKCFGYISGDGIRAFYNLNEALTSANIAKRRMNLLAETKDLQAISEVEKTFTGEALSIELPRDGRNNEEIEQDFTLTEWRVQSNQILETTQQIIYEAMAARAQFLEDQKHEFKRETERVRFKYPRKKTETPKFVQRSIIRADFPQKNTAAAEQKQNPKKKAAQSTTKHKSASGIVYTQKKLAA